MVSPKQSNGPWTKVTQVVLPVIFTAFLGVIGFLALQIFDLKGEFAESRLEDAKRYYELRNELSLRKITVDNLSNKVEKLELTLEKERENEEAAISTTVGTAGDYLDLDSFFVDGGVTWGENH